jgi:beta-mannosidase
MLTCGPWRPVYLESFTARISDQAVQGMLSDGFDMATITPSVELESPCDALIHYVLWAPDAVILHEQRLVDTNATFVIASPQLWFPVGNGKQPLYAITASAISKDGTMLTTVSKRFGIRHVELIQRPLKSSSGTTFFFRVNGVPIFCRGADWVPSSMFLPKTTPKTNRKWIQLMVDGNQNMVRVWAGGIYEQDALYDYCDELGIMVWQDFMLGCGSFPATAKFLGQIEEEAVYNLKRMRAHPSIVLWCGNNEDHMFADQKSSEYDPDDMNPEHWLQTNWPARIIYDKKLPELCAKYVPDTPYHPGSPWGGRPSNSKEAGDVHAWDVWMKASAQYPYQWYHKLAGRFVSEFGLKSYPTIKTINEFITDPKERYPQSRMMEAHMKSASTSSWARDFRTIALYLMENVKHSFTLEKYAYASQLIQAEAMMYAFAGFRRLWKGNGNEECAGILVWQLNDAWPSVSWSLADSNIRKKFAYYSVKRAIAPISVGVSREEIETGRDSELTEVHVHKEHRLQVWASNFTQIEKQLHLEVRGIDVSSGKQSWSCNQCVTLKENQSTELLDVSLPDGAEQTIFCARVLQSDKVIARYFDWPQPLKHLDLPRPAIDIRVEDDLLHLTTDLPVKGLVLEVEDDDVEFDDNCIDLVPGDDQVILAKGLKARHITMMHLALAA